VLVSLGGLIGFCERHFNASAAFYLTRCWPVVVEARDFSPREYSTFVIDWEWNCEVDILTISRRMAHHAFSVRPSDKSWFYLQCRARCSRLESREKW
jgi:hypothetical protein